MHIPSNKKIRRLPAEKIKAFHHDKFLDYQVNTFRHFCDKKELSPQHIYDIGGGIGLFAENFHGKIDVTVVDSDYESCTIASSKGLKAICADATFNICHLAKGSTPDSSIVTFNMVLHHIISSSDSSTKALQTETLKSWSSLADHLFVTEYIYDSYFLDISSWLIYVLTSNRLLKSVLTLLGKIFPEISSNTLGTGVRFRSHRGWVKLFSEAGLNIVETQTNFHSNVGLLRRVLFIKQTRMISYLLAPNNRLLS